MNPNTMHFTESNGVALDAYYKIKKISEIHSGYIPEEEMIHLSESLSDVSKTNLNNLIASTGVIINISNFVRQDTVQILSDLLQNGGWGDHVKGFQDFKFVEFETTSRNSIVIVMELSAGRYNRTWIPFGAFDLQKREFFPWGMFQQFDLRIQARIHITHIK